MAKFYAAYTAQMLSNIKSTVEQVEFVTNMIFGGEYKMCVTGDCNPIYLPSASELLQITTELIKELKTSGVEFSQKLQDGDAEATGQFSAELTLLLIPGDEAGKTAKINKEVKDAFLKKMRDLAVRQAWKQERKLVRETGEGTRAWTESEMQQLLKNGKVEGYDGHHINDVANHPELAGDPDNIKFLNRGDNADGTPAKTGGARKGSEHYNVHHNADGSKKTSTTGPLVSRKVNKK